MNRDSFIFYRSYYEAMIGLKDKDKLQLFNAISELSLNNNEIKLTGICKNIFTAIKPQIVANSERYENGKKGGRPKKETTGFKNKKTVGFENKKPNENDNVNENVNENDNDNVKEKNKKEKKIHFAEFVSMTNAEYEKLVSTHGKEFTDQCITILDNYKGANGKKYKNDYRAILNWVIDKVKKSQPQKSAWEEFMNG